MQGPHVASNNESALLDSQDLDVVQLFCLLGVTLTLAVILHLDMDGVSWALGHIQ